MNGLDLFSGIGGISLALEPWVRTVAYCEKDEYARGVLMSRMRSGDIDPAPIWDDVTTLKASDLPRLDIIFGGFPCQDISSAGRGIGLAGKRSGLFFEIVRLVEETRSPFVFLENVPAIRTRGLQEVIGAFTDLRYDCRWTCLSAASVGAPHLRKRWFLLAHADSDRLKVLEESNSETGERSEIQRRPNAHGFRDSLANPDSSRFETGGCEESGKIRDQTRRPEFKRRGANVADTVRARLSFGNERIKTGRASIATERGEPGGTGPENAGLWTVEPNVGRVAHGVPKRVDRLRCLGNAVVPLQARTAFQILSGIA